VRIYCINSCGQPKRSGPSAWELGEVLTTPHRKKYQVIKYSHRKPRAWTDTLVRPKQRSKYGGRERLIQRFGGEV
jgi:hypothetical protein